MGFLGFQGCGDTVQSIQINKAAPEVVQIIQNYYGKKYPSFSEYLTVSQNSDSVIRSLEHSSKLQEMCPVDYIINSSKEDSICTFIERTDYSSTEFLVTNVDINGKGVESCCVTLHRRVQKKRGKVNYSALKSINKEDILDECKNMDRTN